MNNDGWQKYYANNNPFKCLFASFSVLFHVDCYSSRDDVRRKWKKQSLELFVESALLFLFEIGLLNNLFCIVCRNDCVYAIHFTHKSNGYLIVRCIFRQSHDRRSIRENHSSSDPIDTIYLGVARFIRSVHSICTACRFIDGDRLHGWSNGEIANSDRFCIIQSDNIDGQRQTRTEFHRGETIPMEWISATGSPRFLLVWIYLHFSAE